MYYLTALASAVLLSVNFCFTKKYQKRAGDRPRAVIVFNILGGAASFIILSAVTFFSGGFILNFDISPFSLLFAALTTVCCGAYLLIGFRVMSLGSLSVYTVFLMLGGMALPWLFGMVFLGEYHSAGSLLFPSLLPSSLMLPFRVTGLILMSAAVILSGLSGKDGKRGGPKFFLLCVSVFLLNGTVSVLSKVHQLPENASRAVSSESYVMLNSLMKVLIFSAVFAIMILRGRKQKSSEDKPAALPDRRALLLIPLCAAADAGSYFLQLVCASHLPASALYPFVTGGSVLLTSVCGAVFFGEKPTKRSFFGSLLCFVSTFFFL